MGQGFHFDRTRDGDNGADADGNARGSSSQALWRELAKLAEDYTLSQPPKKPQGPPTTTQPGTEKGLTDHPRGPLQGGGRGGDPTGRSSVSTADMQWGHLMCPKRKETQQTGSNRPALFGNACDRVAWNVDSEKYLRRGKLEGRSVQMLIDSGCSLTMVRADDLSCPFQGQCKGDSPSCLCAR